MRKITSTLASTVGVILTAVSLLTGVVLCAAAPAPVAFEGERLAWAGASGRYDFVMDGQTKAIAPAKSGTSADGQARCVVLVPKTPLPGNQWSWKALYSRSPAERESDLLERGFYVVYTTPGSPAQRDAWFAFLAEQHGLSTQPVQMSWLRDQTLLAGTARVSITPPDPAKPVHDNVNARVLVLELDGERLGFISMDLGVYTSERLVQTCREKYGLSQVFMSSSHTHSDPGGSFASYYDEQMVKAMGEAVSNLFPARIAAGHRSFPQLGFNRLVLREDGHTRESWHGDDHYRSENPDRIPFGPVDPEVGVIRIDDTNGHPRVIIMNYACHADVVCQNYAVSADFPGVACRDVEAAFDNQANCLFVQGAAGNIESLIISSRRSGPDDSFQTDYSTIDRVGYLLAYETIKLAKSLTPTPAPETRIRYLTEALAFHGRFERGRNFDVRIATILINDDIVIATVPGELFVQLQLAWKKELGDFHPFVFGYSWFGGTWADYIPDIRSAATGGYGADQGPPAIEVGAGEAIMNKHLENTYRLTGLMRDEPGPTQWTPGDRWMVTRVPREGDK